MTLPLLTDVADDAGITYRQANYWVQQGWIEPLRFKGKEHAERSYDERSGVYCRLPIPQARKLQIMARLVRAGLKPAIAAKAAHELAYGQRVIIPLGNGVHVLVTQAPQ